MIGNGQTRADIGVQADEQRWQLLVTAPAACAADCQQLVYLARQLQIGLVAMPRAPVTRWPVRNRSVPITKPS